MLPCFSIACMILTSNSLFDSWNQRKFYSNLSFLETLKKHNVSIQLYNRRENVFRQDLQNQKTQAGMIIFIKLSTTGKNPQNVSLAT